MTGQAYPLDWPRGVARTPAHRRKPALFSTRGAASRSGHSMKRALTVADAMQRLRKEVERYTRAGHAWRIRPDGVVCSTNLELRRDGIPYSGRPEPEDPGVAVYFDIDGERRCIPCDRWTRVADNIAGVAGALGALRDLERWVNDAHVKAAFTGFAALPAPGASEHWRDVLGLDAVTDATIVRARYKELASTAHPDKGGSDEAMARLNRARAEALQEVGA